MAKKKQKPDDESSKPTPPPKARSRPKAKAPSKAAPAPSQAPTDAVVESKNDNARRQAETLLHRAFQTDNPVKVANLARQALEIWPDCADAYVLLAELARGPQESYELYHRAMEAAARVMGETTRQKAVGHYWSVIETRPYMRARHGLAQSLWILGRRDEAITHYQEMLRLNPNDNQGIRYNLASCLIELNRNDELAALLDRYENDASASWAYSAALLAFRREGDSPRARKLLASARKTNTFVPDFLTGREMLPSKMPDLIEPGDRDEAVDYAVGNLNGWRSTPGALTWLRRADGQTGAGSERSPKTRPAKGPTLASKKRLKRLPQPAEAAWQAEIRRLPVWMNVDGELRRPWIVLVVSETSDLILTQEVIETEPTAAMLWDRLAEAAGSPSMGEPHRPVTLEVRPADGWEALRSHLDEIGIRLVESDHLELIDDILEKLVEHICGRTPGPGLLEMPGVTPEQVAGFFEAAAGFYREAPWQRVGGSETIAIACDRYESGPWYAVIIGQMGMTLGIALYEDWNALTRMREGTASDEENARETVALSVTYGDETEIPVPDLDAAEQHQWEVAGPDAYPAPIRKERGLTMRPPLAWELNLLEACLRAIPEFVRTHDRNDPGPQVQNVPTGAGPLTLRLAWVTTGPMT